MIYNFEKSDRFSAHRRISRVLFADRERERERIEVGEGRETERDRRIPYSYVAQK